MTDGFPVWAPHARRVELVLAGRRHPMAEAGRGWWQAPGMAAEHDARYGFSLEGDDVRPDPRSPSQPDGVLGLSAVVDHSRFAWRDAAWTSTRRITPTAARTA